LRDLTVSHPIELLLKGKPQFGGYFVV